VFGVRCEGVLGKRRGHAVELRPTLPNGKQSDLVAIFEEQHVYFEIKRLRESDTQLALNRLNAVVFDALSDLTRDSRYPTLTGQDFKVELDTGLADLLGMGPDRDTAIIDGIRGKIVDGILSSVKQGQQVDFVIPAVAKVVMGSISEQERGVTSPGASFQAELQENFPWGPAGCN